MFDLSNLQVVHSIVQGGFSGEGNFSDDPLFLGLDVGDIRLLPDSPAIDAGLISLLPLDDLDLDGDGDVTESLPLDIIGSPRVLGTAPDLGAVEFTGELPAPPIAEATGIAPGETVVLSPSADLPWMATSISAEFTNLFGINDQSEASASLEQFGWDIHPGAAGFTEIGAIGRLATSLSDGEHFTRLIIPFDASAVPGLNVATVRATTFDDSVNAWRVAPALNTGASPGHGSAIGDWSLVFGSLDDVPPLSDEIGDHGVLYDVLKLRGFAWANVDRGGDFGVGRSQCVFDLGPADGDGVIDAIDLGLLLAAWGATGGGGGGNAGAADLDGDGIVGPDDLSILLAAWGPCGSASDQDSAGFDSGNVGGGAPGPGVDLSWFTLETREIGLRLAGWPASAR